MAVSLQKGGNVSLTKSTPGIRSLHIGLGWSERISDGAAFDLDASVFLLGPGDRISRDQDFIFYNNLRSLCGSVEHQGDNRTGAGDGDDETVHVDLSRVPAAVQKLAFCVTIHEAEERRQTFGMIRDAFIRVVDKDTGEEVVRYDLSEDYSTETAMVFGEIYRHNGDWKFRAVGQGYSGGLAAMALAFGVDL